VTTAAAVLMLAATLGTAHAAPAYDPLDVISEETWRASSSMSQADIQAFLEGPLPGEGASVLAGYSCPEAGPTGTSGVVKSASQIIWEACQAYDLNPKVILATLEKEQSLITQHKHYKTATHSHGTDYHIMYALGVGVYAGSLDRHPGFGDQVWNSARIFGSMPGSYAWTPGKVKHVYSYPDKMDIDIVPLNAPTWALYNYTPYYPQISFWNQYVRFFGDPHASPRLKPVYRFYRRSSGTHFYTASEAEKYTILKKLAKTYALEGVAYSLDASATNMTTPLYRFYNKKTGTHFYTASQTERDSVVAKLSGTFKLEGVAYNVSSEPTASTPVYRFFNKKTGTHFYTASQTEKESVVAKLSGTYRFEGIAFYLGYYVPAIAPSEVSSLTTPPAQ
jgi:hypothetical protein